MAQVVHVCPRYAPATGGVELFFAKLGATLARRGDSVTVWTTTARSVRAFASPAGERFAEGRETIEGVAVHRYPVRYLPAQRYLLTAAHLLPLGRGWKSQTLRWSPFVPSLLRDARTYEGALDVVHATALPYSSLLYAAVCLARRSGARLIVTPFTHLGRPGVAGDRIRATYLSPLNLSLLREADRVLVQTRAEHEALAGAGVAPDRLATVGMGVDATECTGGDRTRGRKRWGLTPEDVVVGHLANKSWDKGTVDLLDAAEQLRTRGVACTLLLAGQDMPSFTRRWQATTARDRIVNLGELTVEEKRDFYAAIDLFALPSYVESFGISPLEAAVNHVPSVAYDQGGPAEVFESGVTGLLATPGDISALADALARLVLDVDERRRIALAAARMAADHTWDRALGRALTAYDAPVSAIGREPGGDATAAAAGGGRR